MAILKIRTYGDSILKKKVEPVLKIDSHIHKLVKDMIETLHNQHGVGLAANQVGVDKKLCVIDTSRGERKKDILVLINPEIIKMEGKIIAEEGCLSFLNITGEVERAKKVIVKATNLNGKDFEMEGVELLARAFQHEIDHLNGILFIEHMKFLKRLSLNKQLKELLRLTHGA
ncbi:MAG: peptide deformylase [Candidatus Firestonebacteria bacterium]